MMSTDANPEIGKDPEAVDAEQPDEEEFLDYLDEQSESSNEALQEDKQSLNGQETEQDPGDGLPSREEMWQVIQTQQEQMARLTQRVEELEEAQEEGEDALQQATTQLEEAASQLRRGKLSGEAGADLLTELNNYSPSNLTDSRAVKLYYALVEKEKVGVRVQTSQVVKWVGIDTANPNQTAHRVMKRLEDLTEEGHLIGEVSTFLYRGKRVIEM